MTIGFAMCGSFCTYSQVFPVMELLSRDYRIVPIFSEASYTVDSRFGTAAEHIQTAKDICGTSPLHTIAQAEPIGPKKLLDALIFQKLDELEIFHEMDLTALCIYRLKLGILQKYAKWNEINGKNNFEAALEKLAADFNEL